MKTCVSIVTILLVFWLSNLKAGEKMERNKMFKEVESCVNAGEMGTAEQILKNILRENPKCWEAYNLLGNIALVNGDLKSAQAYYNRALDIDPAQADIYNNLGNFEIQRNDGNKALFYYKLAVKYNPKHSDAWNNIGNIFMATRNYKAAEKYFNEAIKSDPKQVIALTLLAKIKAAQNRNEEALDLFQRALQAEPQLVDVRIDYASFLASIKNHMEAEKQLNEVLARSPKFARGYYIKGIYMRDRHRLQESVECLGTALELEPDNSEYNLEHALSLFQLKGIKAMDITERELRKAVKLAPRNGRTAYFAALCFEDAGDPESAAGLYEKSAILGYNKPKSLLYLGQTLLKLKNKGRAGAVLKELAGQLPAGDSTRIQAEKIMKDNNLN